MKSNKVLLLIGISIILALGIVLPIFSNLIEHNVRVLFLQLLGNMLVITPIIVLIIDIIFLLYFKQNHIVFPLITASLSVSAFLLLEFCFLNNLYDFVYVWSYSDSTLPTVYKMVAIWAGEEGSILTWMVFNSIVILFYRIKSVKNDQVFKWSVLISLVISIIFYIILSSLNLFKVEIPVLFPNGRGLNPDLMSPYMIWHPFFTFIAYAVFLIPFTISLVELIKPDLKLQGEYQRSFYDTILKLGWLVLSVSIGLGAYWAKITFTWGRYWGWDPVEVVSLIPWLLATAYFHNVIFRKKEKSLVKINVAMIFLSIIYATLITRGGGLSSLHAFTGSAELAIWVIIIGAILTVLSLYIIYKVLNYILEEYRKVKSFFDYLSYFFLSGLAFVCLFGLFLPPFTSFLSSFLFINPIFINSNYYIFSTLILAIGLGISLTCCSLIEYYNVKKIILAISLTFIIQLVISLFLLYTDEIRINPLIAIYYLAFGSSLFKLMKNLQFYRIPSKFFRTNSKTIIHLGISSLLIGTLINQSYGAFLDFFYIFGFFILLFGIIPSIIIGLRLKGKQS
ncbi:MAG: cytochrome c biogenesis protein CcsA [Candidatus Lokiarchaeota archaeon]|jgi:cytochrome c-type biogenesis protein CcmF